jgi:hypothetical protein
MGESSPSTGEVRASLVLKIVDADARFWVSLRGTRRGSLEQYTVTSALRVPFVHTLSPLQVERQVEPQWPGRAAAEDGSGPGPGPQRALHASGPCPGWPPQNHLMFLLKSTFS